MTPQDSAVSVVTPLTPAFERVKTILFRPFDLTKWLVIGFCAWLACLGQGGGGGGGGGHIGPVDHGAQGLKSALREARDYVLHNLDWILPLALGVALVIVVLWLAFTWLSSRGQFMFLHCVARNAAEVGIPWTRYARHGDSLFWFRVALGLISLAAILVPVAAGIAMGLTGHLHGVGPILGLVGLILAAVAIAIAFTLVRKLMFDFVVPIMFLHTASCLTAWRRFLALVRPNAGRFLLYILFAILLGIAIALLIFAIVIVTCCCAGCLLAIPYLGTVLLLPVLVFSRSYSLYYLAQYGTEFNVFEPEPVLLTAQA
jgi:hypothetical protein